MTIFGVMLDAYAHGECPMEGIVRAVKPRIIVGRNPFFNVVLQMRNYPRAAVTCGDLVIEELDVDTGVARFGWFVECYERERELVIRSEYNTNAFDSTMMETWLEQWRSIIEQVTAQPDIRLSQL